MTQLAALLGRVHDEFPAVPESLALRALADAAQEFCTRTHIWRMALADVAVVAGVSTYALTAPAGLQIVAPKDVRLDGRKIHPTPASVLLTPAHVQPAGEVTHFAQLTPAEIELDRPPKDAATMKVRAAVTLALGSTEVDVPDALINEYGEAIAAGAKMRLVRQAAQPWYMPDASGLYGGPFYSAITTAKSRVMDALGEADVRVQMRGW